MANLVATEPPMAVLCLHGAGSSGSIFRLQLAKCRLLLKNKLEFIFIDGPLLAPAGYGMLPHFSDAGPFYSWLDLDAATSLDSQLRTMDSAVRTAVEHWECTKNQSRSRIIGVIAFSQGALAASFLLWRQQLGQVPWLPKLHFATLICCYFPRTASEYMFSEAERLGKPNTVIDIHTLHLHGRRDFGLGRARELVKQVCASDLADVLEFDGGHQCPSSATDCKSIMHYILRYMEASMSQSDRQVN